MDFDPFFVYYTFMTGSEDQKLDLSIWTVIHTHTHTHIYIYCLFIFLYFVMYLLSPKITSRFLIILGDSFESKNLF